MKKLLLILLLSPLVSFGQNNNVEQNSNVSVKIEGRKSNSEILAEGEGMSSLGKGLYRIQQTGTTDLASYKKQAKKAISTIKSYSEGLGLDYKIITQEKRNAPVAFGVARAIIKFKLFNKDGSIYLTNEENNSLKEDAKNQLIDLKGFLDIGIITQEEFDKKAESLKKILLGN